MAGMWPQTSPHPPHFLSHRERHQGNVDCPCAAGLVGLVVLAGPRGPAVLVSLVGLAGPAALVGAGAGGNCAAHAGGGLGGGMGGFPTWRTVSPVSPFFLFLC